MASMTFGRGKRITIVMYHAIDRRAHRYCISPDAFRRQMTFIKGHYPIVRLRDIGQALQEAGDSGRKVIITFDDAYCDFYDQAFPVLSALGVPSTMFVPSRFIGRYNRWDLADGAAPRRAIMTDAHLRALHGTGLVDIGSHTADHVRMTGLAIGEMTRQATESKRTLEERLGLTISMFAYPYGQLGDFSRRTTDLLAQAGYQLAVTTHWGTRNSARQRLQLRRISFEEQDDERTLRAKIDGAYDWIAIKERAGFAWRVMRGAVPKPTAA